MPSVWREIREKLASFMCEVSGIPVWQEVWRCCQEDWCQEDKRDDLPSVSASCGGMGPPLLAKPVGPRMPKLSGSSATSSSAPPAVALGTVAVSASSTCPSSSSATSAQDVRAPAPSVASGFLAAAALARPTTHKLVSCEGDCPMPTSIDPMPAALFGHSPVPPPEMLPAASTCCVPVLEEPLVHRITSRKRLADRDSCQPEPSPKKKCGLEPASPPLPPSESLVGGSSACGPGPAEPMVHQITSNKRLADRDSCQPEPSPKKRCGLVPIPAPLPPPADPVVCGPTSFRAWLSGLDPEELHTITESYTAFKDAEAAWQEQHAAHRAAAESSAPRPRHVATKASYRFATGLAYLAWRRAGGVASAAPLKAQCVNMAATSGQGVPIKSAPYPGASQSRWWPRWALHPTLPTALSIAGLSVH